MHKGTRISCNRRVGMKLQFLWPQSAVAPTADCVVIVVVAVVATVVAVLLLLLPCIVTLQLHEQSHALLCLSCCLRSCLIFDVQVSPQMQRSP